MNIPKPRTPVPCNLSSNQNGIKPIPNISKLSFFVTSQPPKTCHCEMCGDSFIQADVQILTISDYKLIRKHNLVKPKEFSASNSFSDSSLSEHKVWQLKFSWKFKSYSKRISVSPYSSLFKKENLLNADKWRYKNLTISSSLHKSNITIGFASFTFWDITPKIYEVLGYKNTKAIEKYFLRK